MIQFMNQPWSPESRVLVTDEGMAIEIKLAGIRPASLAGTNFEEGALCVRGEHKDFGKFECRFEIPEDHNIFGTKITWENGALRITVPPGKKMIGAEPRPMMIYCNGCERHFDIVIEGKGARNYCCPHCGKVQVFDLEALINQVMDQSSKTFRKKRGSR
jgi:hypothetical protein